MTKIAALFLLITALFVQPSWGAVRCQILFSEVTHTPYQTFPEDLLVHRNAEIRGQSAGHVRDMNENALRRVLSYTPPLAAGRARSIEFADALDLVLSIDRHEVVGRESTRRYDPEGIMGYCFGRATYAHLMLLRMGVSRNSILKAWVVGPMQPGRITWQYHVATIVHVKDYGWMVIDSTYREPVSLRDWYNRMSAMSSDGKLRLYITEPDKFGPTTGRYSRMQMGLDLGRESDWYKDYFTNLMASISGHTPEQLGLRRVPADPPAGSSRPAPPTAFDMLRDFFMGR